MHRMRCISYNRVVFFLVALFLFNCCLNATRKNAVNLINEAKVLIERGSLKKAFLKLQKACEEDELFDEPHYYIARIHYLKNDVELAIVEVKKALSLAPHEKKYKLLLNNCRYKKAIKNKPEAETILKGIINADNGYSKAYLKLIDIYFAGDNYSDAEVWLRNLSENISNGKIRLKKETEYLVMAYKAYLQFNKGNHLFAYRLIKKIPEIYRKKPGPISKFNGVITGEKNKVLQLLIKGDKLVREKDFLAAEHYYKEALVLTDDKGYVERKLQAIGNIKSAIKIMSIINKLLEAGKLEEAAEKLQECKDDILPVLDDKKFYLKKINDAEIQLLELRKKSEKNKSKAVKLRSTIKKLKKEFREVTDSLKRKKFVLAETQFKNFNKELKKYNLKKKFTTKAYLKVKKIIQNYHQLLQQYRKAVEKFKNKKYRESIEAFSVINKKSEGFENVLRYIGIAHNNLMEYDMALSYLTEYGMENPDDIEVKYYIAVSMQGLNRIESALSLYNEIKDTKGNYRDVIPRSKEIQMKLDEKSQRKTIIIISAIIVGVVILGLLGYFITVYPQKRREKIKSLARDFTLSRNWKKAQKYVDLVLDMGLDKRDRAQYQLYMAQILLATGKPKRAKTFCENAQKNNFSLRGIEKVLVECMLSLREMTPASMEKYEMYYRKYPDDNRLVELMGRYYIQTEMFDSESLEVVKKYYQMNPTDNRVLMHIVKAIMDEQTTSAENIEYFEKGLTVVRDDKRGKLLMIYAQSCFQAEKFKKIMAMKEELLEFGGENKDINDILVNSAVALDQVDELKQYYEELNASGKATLNMKKGLKRLKEQLLDI
ncbi:hypothetical protein KAJ27_11175 [bacterium]|nr:hypothetical protein [bacterium]